MWKICQGVLKGIEKRSEEAERNDGPNDHLGDKSHGTCDRLPKNINPGLITIIRIAHHCEPCVEQRNQYGDPHSKCRSELGLARKNMSPMGDPQAN